MEYVTIKITKDTFNELHAKKLITWYEIKEVTVRDGFFDNDIIHNELFKKSLTAYKRLKEYEFKKRHDII